MKVRLGDVATYINGYAFKPSDWSDSGVPIIRIQDLTGNSYQANRYSGEYAKKYEVLPGDVLISWSASFGVYIWTAEKAVLNQHIFKVVFDKCKVDKSFFVHQVQNILERAESSSHGATMKHLTKPVFDALPFYLPPLDEQRRIAAVLDKVSDLIAKRRAQLDKLDDLVKARFVEMFGDPYINSMAWKKIKIKAAVIVEPQNGMYKPQSDYVTDGSGTPILRIDGFYDGAVTDFSSLKRLRCNDNEKQKYLLKENDIVINRVNSIEYLGKCAHITGLIEETVYESNMMRMHFDPARFNPVYVTQLLCSRFVYDQVINHAKKAVNQASINQKDVLDIDIYQPSIERQNAFADFVNRAEQSKLTIQQSLDKLEILKKALMQEYFG